MATFLSGANLTADGDTAEIHWVGGPGTLAVDGDFGGGTLKLQASFDGGSTFVDEGTSVTSAGVEEFDLPPGTILKANLSGGTTPDINVYILHRDRTRRV